MAQKIATIKGRILKYIDNQGIKKEDFYKKISMNGQSWRGKGVESELSADKIAIVLSSYRDINPYWLILGEGEMLVGNKPNVGESDKDKEIQRLEMWLRDKEKIIQGLEAQLRQYEQKQPKAGRAS